MVPGVQIPLSLPIPRHFLKVTEIHNYAGMAKLVDALDLGSGAVRHKGSSPFTCTIYTNGRLAKMVKIPDCRSEDYGFKSCTTVVNIPIII